MWTFALQSGSNGNAIFVEAGDTRLLIDAGISGRQAKLRLAEHGRDIRDVDAVLISHDHCDHVRHAGVYHRLFKLPIYLTPATQRHAQGYLGKCPGIKHFQAQTRFTIGDLTIDAIPTPHDAADGVAFVLSHDGKRLGIFTDLGHPFAALPEALASVDAAYLESNYDVGMLASGPYPVHLRRRISGGAGHISNDQAAELLRACGGRLKWAALAHLSHENNTAELALEASRRAIGRDFPLAVATRHSATQLFEV